MSTIVYGRLTRTATTTPQFRAADGEMETPDQKMATIAQALSALVPAEVLAIHAGILAYATVVATDGTTTVTEPNVLKATFPVLLGLTVALFLIGRAPKFVPADLLRVLVPPGAFFAWMLLTGTSAASPWFTYNRGYLLLAGGAIGAIVIALAIRLTPKAS
jgi:hypothetical protein